MAAPPGPDDLQARRARLTSVWLIAGVCVAVEMGLQLADAGLLPVSRLRALAYEYGGFWPGLLRDWRPNFPGQPVAMFVTYAFLHAGVLHLAMNTLTLVSLGSEVVRRVGPRRFLAVYGLSVLGGAVGFGLLAPTLRPMVGASGALFGLAGALAAWEWLDRRDDGVPRGPVVRFVLFLVVLNVGLWWAMQGQLAWETHLGGFVAGAAAAWALRGPGPRTAA
jgi:membrane associated rhomboid family serine protease